MPMKELIPIRGRRIVAAALMLSASGTAMAQVGGAPPSPTTVTPTTPEPAWQLSSDSVQQAPSDDTAQPAVQDGIHEIVVTANRREQRLQDVPIAINAIGADTAVAAGIAGTDRLQTAVPALTVVRQAASASPYIRGIGANVGNANAESSVALYIDGVYQASASTNFFDFNNIERIEVLKGPQGTLFGRNATGGVIHVITKDPTDTPTANASVGYGNYGTVTSEAYLSGGIANGLAANIALRYANRSEGYGKNLTLNRDNPGAREFGVRGKIQWIPGEATAVTLGGEYFQSRDPGLTGQPVPPSRNALGQDFPGRFNTLSGETELSITRAYSASLRVEHDFGPLQLLSVSAYRNNRNSVSIDQDSSALPLVFATLGSRARMYTQEVHLLSPAASQFQWLVGAFYFNYDPVQSVTLRGLVFDEAFANPSAGLDLANAAHTKSYSVFAQGTYPLAENTNLTLGFRYTWDRVDFSGQTALAGLPIIIDSGSQRFASDKPTWRISVDHKFAPEILAYLSYNRGVKSGNFSTGVTASSVRPYDAETLDSFEGGLKTELFDRSVILNLAGFYYKFKNNQFQRFVNAAALVFNGPGADNYGAEVDLQARIASGLTIKAGVGLLHTRLVDFPNAPGIILDPETGLGIDIGSDFNAGGNRLPNAPKFTGNMGFTYDVITGFGKLTFNGNAYRNSGYFTEIDNRLRVDSYTDLSGSIGWTDHSGTLSARIWGRNLTNNYFYAQANGQLLSPDIGVPAPPRTYGVTFGFQF